MNRTKILNESEKKEIVERLNKQFGITEIPGKILMRGKERLFLYSGNLSEEQIRKLEDVAFLERVGSYFAKIEEGEEQIRLSIEGAQILQNQITKNIFDIPEELVEIWMKGNEILMEDIEKLKHKNVINNAEIMKDEINLVSMGGRWGIGGRMNKADEITGLSRSEMKKSSGFVVIKHKKDFLGTGKASENKISNFIPKNRRLREKS